MQIFSDFIRCYPPNRGRRGALNSVRDWRGSRPKQKGTVRRTGRCLKCREFNRIDHTSLGPVVMVSVTTVFWPQSSIRVMSCMVWQVVGVMAVLALEGRSGDHFAGLTAGGSVSGRDCFGKKKSSVPATKKPPPRRRGSAGRIVFTPQATTGPTSLDVVAAGVDGVLNGGLLAANVDKRGILHGGFCWVAVCDWLPGFPTRAGRPLKSRQGGTYSSGLGMERKISRSGHD